MKGEDLFRGLNYINTAFVEEAETVTRLKGERKLLSLRRPVLIAAIIAMLAMLVGCAVVYVLSLNALKLGDQAATRDVFEYDPNSGEAVSCVGQETYTQQVLTLAGLNDTPASQAAREWYAFCESYDPDKQIRRSVWGNLPEFPEEYSGYGLYTQEMKDALDQILEKYDLKLRGSKIEFPTTKQLFRALGMETILRSGSDARLKIDHSLYYENGNLDLYFEIGLPDDRGTNARGYLFYRPKDCLIPDTAVLTQAQWEEWNYTTASGAQVLILRSEETSSAWIFSDMANHTASVRLDAIQGMYEQSQDGVPVPQFTVLSKEQLEQIADSIDFTLEPRLVEGWENLPDDSVPAGQAINGYSIEPVSAFTDGYGYQIILKVTAPEGMALTDPADHTLCVEAGDGVYGFCREDGDGMANTCHVILTEVVPKENRSEDGSYPYPEGNVIPVFWEDLYLARFDFEKSERIVTLLTEGTWKFNIPLSTSDTREIELLTQPITAKACIGWKMDGTDVLEDHEITSILLHPLGIDLVTGSKNFSGDFLCYSGHYSYIVMKDGTWAEFVSYDLNDPIDLDQVAYVQLADETIIPMPGVEEETVTFLSEMVKAQRDADYVPVPDFEGGIELLSEPITMKHLAGYATDSTGFREPLYEYLSISSIILHPKGLAILGPPAFDSPDQQATVVYKDGTQIRLIGMGSSPYCDEPMSQLEAETLMDLSKADYILLPDGTKLTVPDAS